MNCSEDAPTFKLLFCSTGIRAKEQSDGWIHREGEGERKKGVEKKEGDEE